MSDTTISFEDLADWGVLFPGGAGSVYSGTYGVHDGSRVDDVTIERIAHINASMVEPGDGNETGVALLVWLSDGTWAACMAGCDYTGWDCQADAQWKWARTRDEAIGQGLDRYWRERLGVALPQDAEVSP